jgi:Cu/Ag efflux pump CusA
MPVWMCFQSLPRPRVEVQTEAPGLSVEEVDSLITVPLENALNGTPLVKNLRFQVGVGSFIHHDVF